MKDHLKKKKKGALQPSYFNDNKLCIHANGGAYLENKKELKKYKNNCSMNKLLHKLIIFSVNSSYNRTFKKCVNLIVIYMFSVLQFSVSTATGETKAQEGSQDTEKLKEKAITAASKVWDFIKHGVCTLCNYVLWDKSSYCKDRCCCFRETCCGKKKKKSDMDNCENYIMGQSARQNSETSEAGKKKEKTTTKCKNSSSDILNLGYSAT
ncbi:hypothetical protein PGO_011800 [Plasmodium gonderi]|uniref:Variable surface protein n=1 Tax=Plasmodium gonderi TaxID=77519 RepID=A0A1Y1J9T6_PLAGO|nr:hypothetical protein PGO_011800 [Plasmodium gonderi]GAW79030.1 hypothetical protein PGO_011800 [Plasmodium gonderi]